MFTGRIWCWEWNVWCGRKWEMEKWGQKKMNLPQDTDFKMYWVHLHCSISRGSHLSLPQDFAMPWISIRYFWSAFCSLTTKTPLVVKQISILVLRLTQHGDSEPEKQGTYTTDCPQNQMVWQCISKQAARRTNFFLGGGTSILEYCKSREGV